MKKQNVTKWRFLGPKDLTATIAYWAVKQSPYECPTNLVKAIKALHKRAVAIVGVRGMFAKFGFAKFTESQIRVIVKMLVHGTPELQCWNRCRRGKTPDIQVTSRYWRDPPPDRCFIDMGAIEMNVMCSFRDKWKREDAEREYQANCKSSTKLCPALGRAQNAPPLPPTPPPPTTKRFLKKVLA